MNKPFIDDYTGNPYCDYHLMVAGKVKLKTRADSIARALMNFDPMIDRLHLHGWSIVRAPEGGNHGDN